LNKIGKKSPTIRGVNYYMTIREQLIREIEQAPDNLVNELLGFLLQIKSQQSALVKEQQPFWRYVEDLITDIPPEVLDTLPSDGAEQHDHYLYGTPKHEV
jgi:hypothetical protein